MPKEHSTVLQVLQKLGEPEFFSAESYNGFCQNAARLWQSLGGDTTPSAAFSRERHIVSQPAPDVIQVPAWGGVHITKLELPVVEKYLVVDTGRYLAFEWHEQKRETLRHEAGTGLLVYQPSLESDKLRAIPVVSGFSITLEPRQKHCLISLENLLVFETGTDPLGMDQDLHFQYMPPFA